MGTRGGGATYATRALERARQKKLHARAAKRRGFPQGPPPVVENLLEKSLVITFPSKEERRWFTVPAAAVFHSLVLAALVIAPLFLPIETIPPPIVLTFINPAPPPPPPPLKGSPMLTTPENDQVPRPQPKTEPEKTFEIEKKELPIQVPEEILQPKAELQFGSESGLDTGDVQGMEGGVPGGVVGGVPGGILGGVIGGTGTDVPVADPDVGPQLIRAPRPGYSVEAIRKKLSGDVILKVIIDVRGKARVIEILRSIPELDREAIRTVENGWLFRPAKKLGRPVATLAVLTVSFNLY